MELVLSILHLMGETLIDSVTSPLFIIIYALLFLLVIWQYKRVENFSARVVRAAKGTYLQAALLSALLGIAGGLLGSFLLIFLGIDLTSIGIFHLWLIAMLLMLINPRFLCFAYAGGVLSLASLLFGYPLINVPHLMGLIAVLHMVESLLILSNGHLHPLPVYLKREGQIRGGFNLQKFWPIPLLALVSIQVSTAGGGVVMPEWWPLLKGHPEISPAGAYTLLPVLAILGYGEITTTDSPSRRVKKSALYLFLYSLCLLMLAVLASTREGLVGIAALFSPLGHELVIWLGMREESRCPPLYVKPSRGVLVLDVGSGSTSWEAGLRPGDIILEVNGQAVDSRFQLRGLINGGANRVPLTILREDGTITRWLVRTPGCELGIIPVPDEYQQSYLAWREAKLWPRFQSWRKKPKR